MLFTFLEYFCLIEAITDLARFEFFFFFADMRFRDTSLTKVMESISFESKSAFRVCIAFVSFDAFRIAVASSIWLFTMTLLFAILNTLRKSYTLGCGLTNPRPKCRCQLSHPLVVCRWPLSIMPAHIFGGNLAFLPM